MEKQQQQDYALADVVMRMVIKEDDRLKLHPRAPEGFRLALDALFAHPTLDPKEEIEALVRLGWLFERDRMFELADEILDLMANDERTLSVLGITSVSKTQEAKKQFAKLVSGMDQKLAAPVYGKEAPKGTLKVSSFLEPGREMGRGIKPNPSAGAKKPEPKRRFKT
jgi:hypothetical protein